MPLDNYTDAQLRAILRAGPIPAHLVREATLEDKMRLLRLIAEDPIFEPAERQRAADQHRQLRRLRQLQHVRRRVIRRP